MTQLRCGASVDGQICDVPTDAYLCRRHTDQAVKAAAELPSLIRDLAVATVRQTHVYRASGRPAAPDEDWRSIGDGLRPTPLPVDLDAAQLARDTIALWQAYRWVIPHNGAELRIRENAPAIHHRIVAGHRKAERAVDRRPSRLYAGPCHAPVVEQITEVRDGTTYSQPVETRCERDLYATGRVFDPAWVAGKLAAGEKITIRCDGHRGDDHGCGAVHDVVDRQAWLIASVDDALLPLATWQSALPRLLPSLAWPNRTTLWRWAHPDDEKRPQRLFPRSLDRAGVELYRGGDVVELVRAEQDSIRRRQTRGGGRISA